MPKITIELTEDKLLKLIPILLKEGVKHLISPDKPIDIVSHYTIKNTQSDLFDKTTNDVIALGNSTPRNNTTHKYIKGRKLPDIVLELFIDYTTVISSTDAGAHIAELGFKASSASSTLNSLYVSGKLTRIRQQKTFYYSLVK